MPPKRTVKRKAANTVSDISLNYPALKPKDGEPLTRLDLQWDTLGLIFSNVAYRFTPPSYPDPRKALFPLDRTWSFAELYLDCLSNSPKANKTLKGKMAESGDYALNFAKLCLLINTGRMNTTLSFAAESRTALRTFHAIPSIQTDEFTKRNLQDAARIKVSLKSACLPQEKDNMPANLAEVLLRAVQPEWQPPTCVVHLIFLIYAEHAIITQKYFAEPFNIHDILYPTTTPTNTIPSEQRANAFLWLVHRLLETPTVASHDFTLVDGKLPADQLLTFTRRDCSDENIDTVEEKEYGQVMKVYRTFWVKPKPEETPNKVSEDGSGSLILESKSELGLLQPPSSTAGTPRTATSTAGRSRKKRSHSEISIENSQTASVARSTATSPAPQELQAVHPSIEDPATMLSASVVHQDDRLTTKTPRLVDSEQGVADAETIARWTDVCAKESVTHIGLLQRAWLKLQRDTNIGRDPVYDSDEELDWSPAELQARVQGFTFRNYQTKRKSVVRYQVNEHITASVVSEARQSSANALEAVQPSAQQQAMQLEEDELDLPDDNATPAIALTAE